MSRKSGEYVAVVWDGDPAYEAVRGHVSLSVLNAALETEGVPAFEEGTPVRHTYWRSVRAEKGKDYDTKFLFDCAPGRGAFAVTVVDL